MLNTLPQDTRTAHLRAILVHAGALDPQPDASSRSTRGSKLSCRFTAKHRSTAAPLRASVGATADPPPRGTTGQHPLADVRGAAGRTRAIAAAVRAGHVNQETAASIEMRILDAEAVGLPLTLW
jgi:hypothetical protein